MSKRIPKVFREHPLASSLLQHTTEIPYEMVPKYPKLESSKSISNLHQYAACLWTSTVSEHRQTCFSKSLSLGTIFR